MKGNKKAAVFFMKSSQKAGIRTRFAPSPTGFLHIGGARTALFNWLFARHEGGAFILRIEDTDQLRSTEESTRAILDAMTWLGLTWDEGPYFQAQRVNLHKEAVEKLVGEGKAYYCVCPQDLLEAKRKKALATGQKPKYDGTCRDRNLKKSPGSVVRFRCPHAGATIVRDLIKGTVQFSNEELDDLVIERSDGYPTYNFAVVVDDALMEITHVIRGDDHLNNTPRQILIYEALGYPIPAFGHVPMILGSDKTRLSKRHGATSVMAYKDMGYLPEALVNYLVRLGWSYGDQEIFTVQELIERFSLDSVGKAAAVFNPEKLLWLNQHYIRQSDSDRLAREVAPFLANMGIREPKADFVRSVVSDLQSRSKTLVEMAESAAFYFSDDVICDDKLRNEYLNPEGLGYLEVLSQRLPALESFTKEGIESLLRTIAEERGVKLKAVVQPLRVALTGKAVSPGIDQVMITLGKDRVLERIRKVLGRGGK
ncbi:MAG TPA: glutamate--tRNA ligase [Syntrophales bacterium]|nr:glutamate--tRNA ligase [Syntrophales bacterium]HOX94608.1 glutamate--tRNA ligase [Syntrophales bacterium]HPI58027.1 glutamate--tRNA ligase [Syntrophales bacterium]HPN25243.1 glutamate--tRNA ligase [Syntrophales bacterium]HQM29338.1 glutamate--tRNA ligase [Syntrophales bacterium]